MTPDATDPWWRRSGAGWLLAVRVQPGARRTEVVGGYGEELKVRLNAPPVDGKANQALIRFVAAEMGVPSSAVTLVRGATSRSKILSVDVGDSSP